MRPFVYVLQAPHNTFNYYFSGINTQSDRFWLDPSTGQIYVRRILSGETQNTFTVSELYWTFIFFTFYNFNINIYVAFCLQIYMIKGKIGIWSDVKPVHWYIIQLNMKVSDRKYVVAFKHMGTFYFTFKTDCNGRETLHISLCEHWNINNFFNLPAIFRLTFCLPVFIFFSQYNAFARDNGSPQLESASIPVTINVRRNQFPPVFQNEPYSRAITSSVGTGTSILSVTATDADNFVSVELEI